MLIKNHINNHIENHIENHIKITHPIAFIQFNQLKKHNRPINQSAHSVHSIDQFHQVNQLKQFN